MAFELITSEDAEHFVIHDGVAAEASAQEQAAVDAFFAYFGGRVAAHLGRGLQETLQHPLLARALLRWICDRFARDPSKARAPQRTAPEKLLEQLGLPREMAASFVSPLEALDVGALAGLTKGERLNPVELLERLPPLTRDEIRQVVRPVLLDLLVAGVDDDSSALAGARAAISALDADGAIVDSIMPPARAALRAAVPGLRGDKAQRAAVLHQALGRVVSRWQSEIRKESRKFITLGQIIDPSHAIHVRIAYESSHAMPVLLLGESGTGKEAAARAIHELSDRRHRAFVPVNMGGLPTSLIESELFGHLKGAYTGAIAPRKGAFREADGGTVFLDEIGDAPAEVQARLLRVLSSGTVRPIGSDTDHKVEVRVIAATNHPLADRVDEGLFRADLFSRLRGLFPFQLPPLGARGPLAMRALWKGLVERACMRLETSVPTSELSDLDVAALCARTWLGNVRDLEVFAHEWVLLHRGRTTPVPPMWLARALDASRPSPEQRPPAKWPGPRVVRDLMYALRETSDVDERLDELMEAAVTQLAEEEENMTAVAGRLGLEPDTLRMRRRRAHERRSRKNEK